MGELYKKLCEETECGVWVGLASLRTESSGRFLYFIYTFLGSVIAQSVGWLDYGMNDREIMVSAGDKDFLFSKPCSHFWGPPSLLFNGYRLTIRVPTPSLPLSLCLSLITWWRGASLNSPHYNHFTVRHASSTLDYTQSNGRIISEYWIRRYVEGSCEVFIWGYMETMSEKAAKTLRLVSLHSDRESNPQHPEYRAEVLLRQRTLALTFQGPYWIQRHSKF